MKTRTLLAGIVTLAIAGLVLAGCSATSPPTSTQTPVTVGPPTTNDATTTTPIKHLVVIYDENISFDHYFGTYPNAANTDGTTFTPASGTSTPVNLLSNQLLTRNPNEFNPFRLSPNEAVTCDQNHSYGPEQQAANGGRNDKAVEFTSGDSCGIGGAFSKIGLTMGYYDGNTVTALWNYAQNYALNDHSFSSTYGPSTPGALNLISGQTHGMTAVDPHTGAVQKTSLFVSSPNAAGVGTDTDDADPAYDDCSGNGHTASLSLGAMTGTNVGDLLNSKSVSWGWFQGGFTPTTKSTGASSSYAICGSTHANVVGARSRDYVAHHDPFQFYKSTSNPHHLPPTTTAKIGQTDLANHNYDLSDFTTALDAGILPAVSFLKPAAYQNGHAGNSDPIDEQHFLVREINAIEKSKFWASTAIVVAYDDSDGWYDQLSSPILNGSNDKLIAHELVGDQPECVAAATSASAGMLNGYKDRCGPGTRQPLLVISPYAKANFIDSTPTEQTSILSFIETNWGTGRIGDGSFDARAGSLANMFNFSATSGTRLILKNNGTVSSISRVILPATG